MKEGMTGWLDDWDEKKCWDIGMLGVSPQTISYHLPEMPVLANPVNSDLSGGFTVAEVAEGRG